MTFLTYITTTTNLLCNANEEKMTDIQQKLMSWKNDKEELADDDRQEHSMDTEITKEEILYAIKAMKNGKSPSPDGLTLELGTNPNLWKAIQ